MPSGALTARQGLRDEARLQPGQKVLINGASGNVGTFAVQIAKALEADGVAPVIDRCYPLHKAAEALRYLEAGHTTGKVVITLSQDKHP